VVGVGLLVDPLLLPVTLDGLGVVFTAGHSCQMIPSMRC
jgi:hypothetical protein